MRTQQSTNNTPLILLLLCMCAFFYLYPSFSDFLRLRNKIRANEHNYMRVTASSRRGKRNGMKSKVPSNIFIYSGPVVAVKNGRLQTGFVGRTESCLQQEDRLAYRDHTHHGESDIGGSRLLNVNRRILPPSIFVT